MQQQLCQPEQLGQQQQQQGQQVMLCPVRLVYETQILVQPGEQIQPNQTLFINPQNPPPWIQNRPQNQVIYMQQLPNNMVSSVPQHMDQNQMFIQNIPNYYPQQMIQMDQMRQMSNMVQMMPNINQITGQNVNNMAQSVSLNVGQNVNSIGQSVSNINNLGQNVSVNVGQNVMPMANVVQNVSQKPVNVNIAQNISNDRVYNSNAVIANTIMQNQQTTMTNAAQIQERTVNMNQNLVNMQKVAELQGIRPQNVRQPQVTVSPMQNVKFVPNSGDVRPMSVTNINDIRQVPVQNITDTRNLNSPRQMNVTTISNIPNNVVQANMMNKKVPLPNKPNSVMANQVRHYNQTYYRPIQPRPMSVMPMVQNQYLPIGTQTINVPRPTQPTNQNTNEINRKRKSESPDEITKKIPNMGNQPLAVPTAPTISNQVMSIIPNIKNKIVSVVQTDMGVNTNPVHKEVKQMRTVETASTGTQANIAREKQQTVEMRVIPPVVKENVQIESDKLVRNTVFTQARGLLRTEPQIMQPDIISIEKIETVVNPPTIQNDVLQITPAPAETKVKYEEPIKNEITKAINEIKSAVPVKLETNTNIESKPKVKQEVLVKKEEKPIKEVPKPPNVEVKVENSSEVKKPEVTETKAVKTEDKPVKELSKKVTVAMGDLKGSEIQIADGSVRKEHSDSFILTHVLDGYVIQESNTAFPIRKPLKEKTIYQNMDLAMDHKKEETPYKHRTEDGKIIKDNSKILTISDLNLNEDDNIKTEDKEPEKSEEDHPFANLKPATIKSWTVDQLASHLSKFKWAETISVLSEHEIDGESLFLVSKPQLVQIGVSETHADLICDFVKKS